MELLNWPDSHNVGDLPGHGELCRRDRFDGNCIGGMLFHEPGFSGI